MKIYKCEDSVIVRDINDNWLVVKGSDKNPYLTLGTYIKNNKGITGSLEEIDKIDITIDNINFFYYKKGEDERIYILKDERNYFGLTGDFQFPFIDLRRNIIAENRYKIKKPKIYLYNKLKSKVPSKNEITLM